MFLYCLCNNHHTSFPESTQAAKYGGCFTAKSTVTTSTGKRRKLTDLRVGDSVLAWDASAQRAVFSEVIMFLDYDPKQRRDFLRFTLASGRSMTVTPTHLLVTPDHPENLEQVSNHLDSASKIRGPTETASTVRFASEFSVGDRLLVKDSESDGLLVDAIVEVEVVTLTGVYAPLTAVGTVFVDDVLASCYATVDSQTIAHWSFAPVRLAINVRDGFYRVWGLMSSPVYAWTRSKTPDRPAVGVHWYARFLYVIGDFLIPSRMHK